MLEISGEEIKNGKVLFFNKPYGWTSFQVVNKVRWLLCRKFGFKKLKVGHAGTLDPLADGLLILCAGKATKNIPGMMGLDKEYVAQMKFGETTPSYDLETKVDKTYPTEHIDRHLIEKALTKFKGEIEQIPPLFSAKQINGTRAYHYARRGEEMELKPSKVIINSFDLIEYEMPFATFRINCSKGTYIRSLARDLGLELNSGAHLTKLTRTKIGDYLLVNADTLENFEKNIALL